MVGVSLRTLENSFKKLLGVTPLKFDHYRRLIQTHQTLRSAEPETSTTVTQIATEMGFTELGRFAGQYQRMFGEQPSETLNKRSNSQPVSLADFLLKRSRQHP